MGVKTLKNLFAAGCLAGAMIAAVPGCEPQQEVLDVETPEGEVEVNRNPETGEEDVTVTEDEETVQP